MVLKAKSDETIKPLKNVSGFTAWQLPSLELGNVPGYTQPVEEIEEIEPSEEEQAQVNAEELQSVKDSAYQEGFSSGRQEGLEAAKKLIDEQLNLFSELIDGLAEPTKQCGEQTQQQLLQLAFAIARQIVRRELTQNPDQIIAIIREAVKLLPVSTQKITISLHPEDANVVKKSLSIDVEAGTSRWLINDDPSIERGSCQVNTENSKIDASIDKQIAVLFSRLAGGQRSGETDAE